ncbi:hypothetical protein [Pararhizobium sp. O133]|uniref:hypothetical protein n=1 Tax=Pararhizobium sp. O133 TaxID=3449278 RepID=UPI003F686084
MSNALLDLHTRYIADRDAWMATQDENGELTAAGPVYEQAWASCKDFVRYQCQTAEDIRMKVAVILENGWLEETADMGFDDEPFTFRDFLRTLVPGGKS